ncbi:SDR family NAD(P)-dependent oxidoreductase [Actinotalea ferrariae]|uniref:SDR family NAD(P)-dependent oxidoreductase n=1 Tax=Actinotalea ferrariae TaxID=1386098 RepID=UPI001C8C7E42|nr:SDR family NAD(P)-dependent oxidoreductase [Actinotalea ferrariae]MBX9243534.1 SDR family NAD(P)-dependent oxidoreductase [Actinotalea ferrariae]
MSETSTPTPDATATTADPAATADRPLALVTGASSGIGLELARLLVRDGHDLVAVAEDAELTDAALQLRSSGMTVVEVRADLATADGVEHVVRETLALGRSIDVLVLNAGVGVGGPFLGAPVEDQLRLVDLNVRSVVHLAHRLLPAMVARGDGKVLVTSSVAASMPAPYNATYAASKAFVQSFTEAIRRELKDVGVSVTALQPGPTDTEFFERGGLEDSLLGKGPKDPASKAAKKGYKALMKGKARVVVGGKGKSQTAMSRVLPETASAAMHGALSKPRGEGAESDG